MDRNARKARLAGWGRLLAGIALGGVATVVVLRLGGGDGSARAPWAVLEGSAFRAGSSGAAIEKLEKALTAEVQARKQLADRIAELDAEISLLRLMTDEAMGEVFARSEPSAQDSASEEGSPEQTRADPSGHSDASRFEDEVLLSQGIHPREVARIRDLWVSHELERASLANRALRGGWFFKGRHRQELRRMEKQLREELQDEGYDRYLYALGKQNRLRAGEVLEGSPASEAGLLRGDVILRYGDTRVFKPGELLLAASRGEPGESVAVEILRNGRRRTVYMRRGPLGVVMERSRGAPLRE